MIDIWRKFLVAAVWPLTIFYLIWASFVFGWLISHDAGGWPIAIGFLVFSCIIVWALSYRLRADEELVLKAAHLLRQQEEQSQMVKLS